MVEEYAKETLKIDMDNDIVYYPDVTTHYTELQNMLKCKRRTTTCNNNTKYRNDRYSF